MTVGTLRPYPATPLRGESLQRGPSRRGQALAEHEGPRPEAVPERSFEGPHPLERTPHHVEAGIQRVRCLLGWTPTQKSLFRTAPPKHRPTPRQQGRFSRASDQEDRGRSCAPRR